jgi:alpha(1,3/1,4) fucosyltransferase
LNILFHNYYEELNDNNRLFDQRNSVIGDDLLRPFQVLKEQAANQGITVGTSSVISLDQADAIVFMDLPVLKIPHVRQMVESGKPLYLLVFESRIVRPITEDSDLIRRFRKIFTYDDSMVDGELFIKINYSFDLPRTLYIDTARKDRFCAMIAGNKQLSHPQELYSQRIEAIRWFERSHPEQFDLYGVGWDEHCFGFSRMGCRLNRFSWLKRLLAPHYPSYRGRVERKRPVLERYKFAICYENVRDVPGYITEKIFDCFFAGCVPVYWGADNINEYVPAGCFIDRREFGAFEEVYNFMAHMDDERYRAYQEAIQAFLAGPLAERFSSKTFAKTLLDSICANGFGESR